MVLGLEVAKGANRPETEPNICKMKPSFKFTFFLVFLSLSLVPADILIKIQKKLPGKEQVLLFSSSWDPVFTSGEESITEEKSSRGVASTGKVSSSALRSELGLAEALIIFGPLLSMGESGPQRSRTQWESFSGGLTTPEMVALRLVLKVKLASEFGADSGSRAAFDLTVVFEPANVLEPG